MDRDILAQLLMQAAMGGNHPMGGHQPYNNDLPHAPPPQMPPQVPPGWMPPGVNFNAPPPVGGNPPIRLQPAPNFTLPAKRPGATPETVT